MEVNFETLPIGEDAPATMNVVVEVLAGSRNKYEPEIGVIIRDPRNNPRVYSPKSS